MSKLTSNIKVSSLDYITEHITLRYINTFSLQSLISNFFNSLALLASGFYLLSIRTLNLWKNFLNILKRFLSTG